MHILRWLIYWLDSLIMILWLEILGGRAHLSLQDLVGGQFWGNKPSLGFHGATRPRVWCQEPACQMREIRLGQPWWWLGQPIPPLTFQTIFPRGAKHSTFELDVMLLGLGHGGEVPLFWHMDVWGGEWSSPWWDSLDAWHVEFGGLSMLLQHQRLPQSNKTSPKGVMSS